MHVSDTENTEDPTVYSSIKQLDSIPVENKSCVDVSNSVFFRLKEDKVRSPGNTILKINHSSIIFCMLKSLDPYTTAEEEKQMKTMSPDFRKGCSRIQL
ncbi:hypothetical protein CDAR_302031 [Caerostris darwini]|uniref:Uncharacterized protein n=1 Tax=Caerostris darwini TaxID=1538125 RepID=A0AAV4SDB4_9ARAC|nr:hypothetical protein CDAR_302071 [Caerostris darwini]GIY43737.1 hypothetical protein CDAR_302031 [Caerostris darwini]